MASTDAAVRSTVVRDTNISTLWGNGQGDCPSFRCDRCGRTQFIKAGRRHCIVCHASIWVPAPHLVRLPFGHWLCKRLRNLRILRGIPQHVLAGQVHCPRSYISKYENLACIPNLATLGKLAAALSVEVSDLLDKSVTVEQLAATAMLDPAERASHEAVLAEIATLAPRLNPGARATVLSMAQALMRGQLVFSEWCDVH